MNYKQSEFKEAVIKRCQENMANAGVQAYTAEQALAWAFDALLGILAEERITAKNGN